MSDARLLPFDTLRDATAQFLACVAAATQTLALFDPDCAIFKLGSSATDAALRAFLARGGSLRLALHDTAHIERHDPRFLRLLREYAHACECRVTPRTLRHLTDSFCVGDARHVMRRFHSDHARGEASFDNPAACELSLYRFEAIWLESRSALHPTTTGL